MTWQDLRPGDRCPTCGHLVNLHRANAVTQTIALDDPVPCFAVVDVERHPDPRDRTRVVFKHDYCKCQHLMNGDGQ